MELHTWLIYLAAAIGLSLSPGPNGLLALTHGALHGRRKVLYTIFGGAIGFVAVIALSMFGIGALLAASLTWLMIMKWVGGAYLVWLGVQVWRSPPIGIELRRTAEPASGGSLFRQGALSALTNPKGLLFFAAFLPQFIDPAGSAIAQSVAYGTAFVAIAACTDASYALAAGAAAPLLARAGRGRDGTARYIVAGAYFGLAAYTLALGSRNAPPKG